MEYTKDGYTKCAYSDLKSRKSLSSVPGRVLQYSQLVKMFLSQFLNVKKVSVQNWSLVFVSAKVVVFKCSFQKV